ncbi:plasmalemma vesicle-associated protein [Erethizon dorsatum]
MGMAMQPGAPYTRAGGAAHGCWFYLRYFFLFASLTQLLIILGLVLFMVYGNVHQGTEANLQDTERRAAALHTQVVGLAGAQANLTRELNLTARAKDAIMQMLLSARRDLDGLNASFRQCQADRVTYMKHQQYMVAIILSEQQCQEQLKANNKSSHDRFLVLEQKSKTLEMELAKEKALCRGEQERLAQVQRELEVKLVECGRAREQLAQQQQLAEGRLQQVQGLCAPLDRDKLETELRALWRDAAISRTLDNLGYHPYHPLSTEVASIRRACDQLPALMATKGEELARGLRAGIERVARENAELRAQKLEAEQRVRAGQAAAEKAQQEAAQREAQLRAECARQTQLALEEKGALRKERDALAKELDERKRQAAQLQMQVEVKGEALDTCLKAKSQPMNPPRPVAPAPNPPPIDPASLEEFRKRILEAQRVPMLQARDLTAHNPAWLCPGGPPTLQEGGEKAGLRERWEQNGARRPQALAGPCWWLQRTKRGEEGGRLDGDDGARLAWARAGELPETEPGGEGRRGTRGRREGLRKPRHHGPPRPAPTLPARPTPRDVVAAATSGARQRHQTPR